MPIGYLIMSITDKPKYELFLMGRLISLAEYIILTIEFITFILQLHCVTMPELKKNPEKTPYPEEGGLFSCIPARYVVAGMCFSGITLQYTIKVLLSVAIVAMVKSGSEDVTQSLVMNMTGESEDLDVCPGGDVSSDSADQEGEFDWSEDVQGYALSAYYYGYVATQLFGGRLSEVIGSKLVLGPGVFVAGLVTLFSPMAAKLDISAFIAARVLVGAASGLVIPSMNNILVKWFVPEEMSFIGGIMMAGIPAGTCISMVLSGVLADAGGWPLVFYFFGGLCVAFIIPWYFLAYDTPDVHPRISETEKNAILNGIGQKDNTKASQPVPWIAILTSGPMWVHMIMAWGYSWVGYTMLSELPTYLSKILHFNLQEWLRLKGYVSRITAYYIFNGISGYGSAACLLAITFVGCDSTIIVVLLTCTMFLSGLYQGGSFINHVDLGKNFTGSLAGIYFTALNSMGILAPTITGILINEQQTLSRWKIVFYVGTAFPTVVTTLYLLFGTAEEQSWNKLPEKDNEPSEITKAHEAV
ncbi:Sialin [Blattella germanica]|nr:Sialin [Blattella germanica]